MANDANVSKAVRKKKEQTERQISSFKLRVPNVPIKVQFVFGASHVT